MLQAWFFGHLHPSETTIVHWRNRLREAEQSGIWDQEMRPVRNTLSRARLKLLQIGIEVNAILETGYMLEKRRERAGKRRARRRKRSEVTLTLLHFPHDGRELREEGREAQRRAVAVPTTARLLLLDAHANGLSQSRDEWCSLLRLGRELR